MIRVAVSGALGRMGKAVRETVECAEDLLFVVGIDPSCKKVDDPQLVPTIEDAVRDFEFEVLVDFTNANALEHNLEVALGAGIDCVVGTTGVSQERLRELSDAAPDGTCLFFAPNFTTGAVLMMKFAEAAAPYFPEAEVLEFHHCNKKDAPSGTAVSTAQIINKARGFVSSAPGKETEIMGAEGARGALIDGVPVHSIRSMGFVASQEVVFGSKGQTLRIRHDSWDTDSYMPGILLGIRNVGAESGFIVGLDKFMG